MPSAPTDFRPICGRFVFVFNGFMFYRAKEKKNARQRTLILRNRLNGVLMGLLLSMICFRGILLQRAGDVELNPGPRSKDNMKQTRLTTGGTGSGDTSQPSKQQDNDTGTSSEPTLRDVVGLLTNMNIKFDNMQQDFSEIRGEFSSMKDEINDLREEVVQLRRENEVITKQNELYNEKIERLEKKTDDLESRSKRNNIIFYGIPWTQSETSEECETKVKEMIKDKMKLTTDVEFDRVHRLSAKDNAPIIARCTLYKQRMEILKAKKNLQGATIFVGEDFSQRVRDVRKKLSTFLKKAKTERKKATMIFYHC